MLVARHLIFSGIIIWLPSEARKPSLSFVTLNHRAEGKFKRWAIALSQSVAVTFKRSSSELRLALAFAWIFWTSREARDDNVTIWHWETSIRTTRWKILAYTSVSMNAWLIIHTMPRRNILRKSRICVNNAVLAFTPGEKEEKNALWMLISHHSLKKKIVLMPPVPFSFFCSLWIR